MNMEKPLTQNFRPGQEPLDLRGYEQAGGYQALRKALREMTPQDVQDEVSASRLRGRGGAGFPTGKKWSFVPMGDDAPGTKYLIANADEMEAGTFKDRQLMEGDPNLFVESLILSAYAIQAGTAYIFLRWAYKLCERRMRRAIAEAYDAGYLGRNILNSGFSLDLHVHVSAGRYMCGEETGLLNALEGRRANPRAKPPYPPVAGLFGKPSIVNNVETLCNVPGIVLEGSEWFRGLSRSDDGGTKLYGVSGQVRRPGLWELPLGTTMREILEEHAGGMRDGYKFRAVMPGGASTGFMIERDLDVPMDFSQMGSTGTRLGTGTAIVLDDKACPVGMIHNLEHYFAQESCGWCTPCREGLPWTEKVLWAIETGEGRPEDIDRLAHHSKYLDSGFTFCALAPGAVEPLKTGLKHFRDDFERHIREKRCPWRS
jgi:NADH-quinone oxidoreductase subunit F